MQQYNVTKKSVGPFMKVFGSKWSASRRGVFPDPIYDTIYEPFAGGAGYSCRYYQHQIIIKESNLELYELWKWLIEEADESKIKEIPIFQPNIDIQNVGLSLGQMLLVKWWQRTNNHGTVTFKTSPWGNKPGQWTASTRSRISEQVSAIKHWKIVNKDVSNRNTTVFLDPPYQFNYQYGQNYTDSFYENIAKYVKDMKDINNQVIVCEAIGKNGETPKYLPFNLQYNQVTSRRKTKNSHHSKELLYIHNP